MELNISVVNENFNAILYGLVEPSWFKDIPNDIGMYKNFKTVKSHINLLIYISNNLKIKKFLFNKQLKNNKWLV